MVFDLRANLASVFRRGGAGSAFAVDANNTPTGPVAVRAGDYARNRILTCDSSVNSGAGDFTATDTTAITLPFATFNRPMLRRNGLFRWDIMGDYENTVPNNTTLSAQLIVNATPTGSLFSWTQNGAVTSPGVFMLQLDLRTIGNLTSPRHIITAELTVLNSSGTAVIGPPTSVTRLHQIFSLDSLADQLLGWQISKSVSVGVNPISVHSTACYEIFSTSGV